MTSAVLILRLAGHDFLQIPQDIQVLESLLSLKKLSFLSNPKNAPSGHKYLHHRPLLKNAVITTNAKIEYAKINSSNSFHRCPSAENGS